MQPGNKQRCLASLAVLAAASGAFCTTASAQTVIHFTALGRFPQSVTSLVEDRFGNLFRATGPNIVELTPPPKGSTNWTTRTIAILSFQSVSQLTVDNAGNIYGAAPSGDGFGAIFRLLRPTMGNTWQFQLLYDFDYYGGSYPTSLTIDPLGNVIGTTYEGGDHSVDGNGLGVVFRLSPPAGGQGPWVETVLHEFTVAEGNGFPDTPPILDANGNLFGATNGFGFGSPRPELNYGTVYELSPQPGGEYGLTTLHTFKIESDGIYPQDALARDPDGNLYGATFAGGAGGGTVFRLSPPAAQGGKWRKTTLYAFGADLYYPITGVTLTSDGSLFGVALGGGSGGRGAIYRLQPPARPGQPWTKTDVVDFATPANSQLGLDASLEPPLPDEAAPGVTLLRSGRLAATTNTGFPRTAADFLIP